MLVFDTNVLIHAADEHSNLGETHIAVLMREHGVSRICTRDAGFRRFPFLTVLDPLGEWL